MDIRIASEAAVQPASASGAAKAPSIPPVPPPPAVANISPFGDLLGRLRELSDASPVVLRQVSSQLHDALHEATQKTTGSTAAVTGDLAQRFGEVAKTGSLASLQGLSSAGAYGSDAARSVVSLLAKNVDAALQSVRGAA